MVYLVNISSKRFVEKLENIIIGQLDAKRALAIAIRNRWRRSQLDGSIQKLITPKNILMIGPTGVGKTALIKAVADVIDAPLLKVEATRYTQVGYVGENVESMIKELALLANDKIRKKRDLYYSQQTPFDFNVDKKAVNEFIKNLNSAIGVYIKRDIKKLTNIYSHKQITRTKKNLLKVDQRIEELVGDELVMVLLTNGIVPDELNGTINDYDPKRNEYKNAFLNALNDTDELFDCYGKKEIFVETDLKEFVENKGIIFIDEIDKIAEQKAISHDNVGKIGVQRDLLAILDGATINTSLGTINTENILFIVAGAFHVAEVSDLIPELLGRLPIKIELEPVTKDMMIRILRDTISSPINQYRHLLSVDGVELEVKHDAIVEMAEIAERLNKESYPMGARTLNAVAETVFSKIAYEAFKTEKVVVKKIIVDGDYVKRLTKKK